jgi:hypothetical protein
MRKTDSNRISENTFALPDSISLTGIEVALRYWRDWNRSQVGLDAEAGKMQIACLTQLYAAVLRSQRCIIRTADLQDDEREALLDAKFARTDD